MSKHPIVSVEVRKGNIQKALKIFKRRMEDSGHLQLLREKQTYTKPTTKRRKQKLQAIRNRNRQTMIEKYEDGDSSIRLFTKKRKKRR
tara:strand:- start:51 stop:314 length:264 start_codon:yes stop_codon:yes gene_type:complete